MKRKRRRRKEKKMRHDDVRDTQKSPNAELRARSVWEITRRRCKCIMISSPASIDSIQPSGL